MAAEEGMRGQRQGRHGPQHNSYRDSSRGVLQQHQVINYTLCRNVLVNLYMVLEWG